MDAQTFTVICDSCPYRSKWATYREALDAALRHQAANRSDQLARKGVTCARAVVVLLTVGTLIGLTPAAYADPPDPTWITGYWDDDDFDNSTEFITDACAIEVASPVDIGPLFVPVASLGSGG